MTESLKVNSSYIGTALSQNIVGLCLQKHTMNCTIGYSVLKSFIKYTNFHHLTSFTYWLRFCWLTDFTGRAKDLVHRHRSDGHHGNTYKRLINNKKSSPLWNFKLSSYQAKPISCLQAKKRKEYITQTTLHFRYINCPKHGE